MRASAMLRLFAALLLGALCLTLASWAPIGATTRAAQPTSLGRSPAPPAQAGTRAVFVLPRGSIAATAWALPSGDLAVGASSAPATQPGLGPDPATPLLATTPDSVAASRKRAFSDTSVALLSTIDQASATGTATRVRRLWINGTIALTADETFLAALAARPDVAAILPDAPLVRDGSWPALASSYGHRLPALAALSPSISTGPSLPALVPARLGLGPLGPARTSQDPADPDTADPTWSVAAVRAPEAWQRLGIDGSGVTVAIADSGVDYHHPALTTRFRGHRAAGPPRIDGHWWCQSCGAGNRYPYDSAGQAGHGTHVAGIVLGGEGYGVAPGARWIAARACDPGDCSDSTLLAALQWLLDLGEESPQVINTSLTTRLESSVSLIKPAVDALEAAGILVVGSTGNDVGKIGAPGGLASALGVGATTDSGELWLKSRWGTSPFGGDKPDVVAPGAGVVSAMPGGGAVRLTGTSMASPHVAGLAALVLSAAPDLTPAQVRAVITSTARPLVGQPPDKKTGWGLVDAYAAVKSVRAVGTLRGRLVRDPDGAPIPEAIVRVTDAARDPVARVPVDEDGRFSIDLQPGSYVLFFEAFGYVSRNQSNILIEEDQTNDLGAIALVVESPRGTFSGRLIDGETGAPVTGTLAIEGAPRPLATDALGFFSIQLPARTYQVDIAELGYRALRDSVKVVGGQPVTRTYRLEPAPRILLVDGDAWAYGEAAGVVGRSLSRLRYVFDRHFVTDETAGPGRPDGAPSAEFMADYDLVLWSSALSGPAYVRGAGALASYLDDGGRLLLSGQDALCVDAGVDAERRPCDDRARPHPYVRDALHLRVVRDATTRRLVRGAPEGPLSGITLTLNGPGSLDNQDAPDVIESIDPLHTDLIAHYDDGEGAAAFVSRCEPHRSVALGFGLEGIAGDATRDLVLERLIDALVDEPPAHGAFAAPKVDALIRAPGHTADFTVTLTSTGLEATTFDIEVQDDHGWPTELWSAGFTRALENPIRLEHCASAVFGARVRVPEAAAPGAAASPVLRMRAREAPVARDLPLSASAPAPVLLVDGEFQSATSGVWSDALEALGIAHDTWTLAGDNPRWEAPPATALRPPDGALSLYPAVLWFVGYDFRDDGNLAPAGQKALADYLDEGGRLLLSSEDYLWARGETPFEDERLFHDEYLGVRAYQDNAGAAHQGPLRGAKASIYEGLADCRLEPRDPMEDRSDRLTLRGAGRAALFDIFDQPVAGQLAARDFRSVFLAFDPGRDAAGCLPKLLAPALDWFAPLSDSELRLVDAAGRPTPRRAYGDGDRLWMELVVRTSATRAVPGATVRWSIPEGAQLDPTQLPPGWQWDAPSRSLDWRGDVAPGLPLRATLALTITPRAAATGLMRSEARLTGAGLTATKTLTWRVNAPDLSSASKSTGQPGASYAYGREVAYFLSVRNNGSRAAEPFLVTDTLPAGLALVPESWIITAGAGEVSGDLGDGSLRWRGEIPPGGLAGLSYRARVVTHAGGPLTNVAVVDDGTGERHHLAATIFVEPRLLLPWLGFERDDDP